MACEGLKEGGKILLPAIYVFSWDLSLNSEGVVLPWFLLVSRGRMKSF